jgi:hypothetical protein
MAAAGCRNSSAPRLHLGRANENLSGHLTLAHSTILLGNFVGRHQGKGRWPGSCSLRYA